MPGANCALFGCSTSRKSDLSLFTLPFSKVSDGDETKALKEIARLNRAQRMAACDIENKRIREMTPELKKRIDENMIFLCERHFKGEMITNIK